MDDQDILYICMKKINAGNINVGKMNQLADVLKDHEVLFRLYSSRCAEWG